MDRKEYLDKLAEINQQLKMLKDDYITSNDCIPTGNYVIVTCEGKETRCYLKDYKIVNGYIKPIFNGCSPRTGMRDLACRELKEFPGNITMRLA